MSEMYLLHGSDHIIEKPLFANGNEHNDYGQGFYCTTEYEMAQEWACKKNTDGFVNRYVYDENNLRVLDLQNKKYSVLNWIALLLKYRTFHLTSEIAATAREYIIDNFSIDLSDYDVVKGYRADDSYFSFAEGFVSNTIPMRSLGKALQLGKLGLQTVLISEKAFESIRYKDSDVAEKSIYYPKFTIRDSNARKTYKETIKNTQSYRDDIFVLDIIREEMKNDDPRIQRIILD